MREIKLKCPYCGHAFAQQDKGSCPACGRLVLIPPRLRRSSAAMRDRYLRFARQRRDRMAQRRQHVGGWASTRRLRITLAIVAFFVLGILLPMSRRGEIGPIRREPSKEARALKNLWVLRTAIECFHQDCGRYPTTDEGLVVLVTNSVDPEWKGPYIVEMKVDPWRNAYYYALTDEGVYLSSAGPDGRLGTSDDVLAPLPDPEVPKLRTVPNGQLEGRPGEVDIDVVR